MNEGSQSYRAAKASDNIPKRKSMLDSGDVHLSFKLELYFQLRGEFFLLLLHFIGRLCAGSFTEKSAHCACNSFHAQKIFPLHILIKLHCEKVFHLRYENVCLKSWIFAHKEIICIHPF